MTAPGTDPSPALLRTVLDRHPPLDPDTFRELLQGWVALDRLGEIQAGLVLVAIDDDTDTDIAGVLAGLAAEVDVVGWVEDGVAGVLLDAPVEDVDALAALIARPAGRWRPPAWVVAEHAAGPDAPAIIDHGLAALARARTHPNGAIVWTDGTIAEP